MLQLRPYQPPDYRFVVEAWNRSLPLDPVSERLFFQRILCDANFDPEGALVATDEESLCGFFFAVARKTPLGGSLEPEQGWITVFFVAPAYRQQGVGTRLLEAACAYLRRQGVRQVDFSPYAPHYFLPGLDTDAYPSAQRFLQKHGFYPLMNAAAMSRSLIGYAAPAAVQALARARREEGYALLPLSEDLFMPLLGFVQEQFSADWLRAVREGAQRGVPLERTLLLLEPAGKVLGFSMYGAYDHHAERFGPFGVASQVRGQGLGKLLLHETLYRMRQEGMQNVWFLWVDEDSDAERLYRSSGFGVTRRFTVFRREL